MTVQRATTSGTEVALRRDARRNREQIVAVAREVFRAQGLSASMAEVARRGEIGIATVFRRFPTKEHLIAEVFSGPVLTCADMIDAALITADSPAETLERLVRGVCELQLHDRGFADVLASAFSANSIFDDARDRMTESLEQLITAAKAASEVRADLTLDDIATIVVANAGLTALPAETAVAHSDRLVTGMLGSFRARAGMSPRSDELPRADH